MTKPVGLPRYYVYKYGLLLGEITWEAALTFKDMERAGYLVVKWPESRAPRLPTNDAGQR